MIKIDSRKYYNENKITIGFLPSFTIFYYNIQFKCFLEIANAIYPKYIELHFSYYIFQLFE